MAEGGAVPGVDRITRDGRLTRHPYQHEQIPRYTARGDAQAELVHGLGGPLNMTEREIEELALEYGDNGRTCGGWGYGEFVQPFAHYLRPNAIIEDYGPGPKIIRALYCIPGPAWCIPSIGMGGECNPVTPHFQWNIMTHDVIQQIEGASNRFLESVRDVKYLEEDQPLWDESISILSVNKPPARRVEFPWAGHGGRIQLFQPYDLYIEQKLYQWGRWDENEMYRTPHSLNPLMPALKTLWVHSHVEVVTTYNWQGRIVSSNMATGLQRWLDLIAIHQEG